MIPQFPKFKKLALADKPDIDAITSKYQPYSDFNFVNLWSWDIQDNCEISLLNGNLVIITIDHGTGYPVCSFLGNNLINETLEHLLDFVSSNNDRAQRLGVVPEISIIKIDMDTFLLEIELNNCDYIYDIKQLANYSGNAFYKKRKRMAMFNSANPNSKVEILDIAKKDIVVQLIELNDKWSQNKNHESGDFISSLPKERTALQKFLDSNLEDSLGVGVYIENKLVGFNLMTLLPNSYVIGLFLKYDKNFYGVNEYLMNASAHILLEKGYKYINGQEDLGLPGLRISKSSYHPTGILRKYSIHKR